MSGTFAICCANGFAITTRAARIQRPDRRFQSAVTSSSPQEDQGTLYRKTDIYIRERFSAASTMSTAWKGVPVEQVNDEAAPYPGHFPAGMANDGGTLASSSYSGISGTRRHAAQRAERDPA